MGELTTLSIATSKKESLRTTVPMSIVKQFNLQAGDKLDWIFDVKNGEMVILVRPVKEKK
jgi:antitoxin component of MazEF toxin-antitoxin module